MGEDATPWKAAQDLVHGRQPRAPAVGGRGAMQGCLEVGEVGFQQLKAESVQLSLTNSGDPHSWTDLATGGPLQEVRPGKWRASRVALGVQFGRDHLWYAHLKKPDDEAGVMIPTTPEGARELFQLRDHEPGASRRTALVHWVTEHSRRVREDAARETRVRVREHLRGTARFKWQDVEGAIHPAPYDLWRIEQGK